MKQPGMTQPASQSVTGPGAAFVPLSHPSLQPPFPSVSSSLPSLSYQLHPHNPTHHNSQRTRRRQRRDCRPVALLGRTILFHSVGSASDCGADYSLPYSNFYDRFIQVPFVKLNSAQRSALLGSSDSSSAALVLGTAATVSSGRHKAGSKRLPRIQTREPCCNWPQRCVV